MKTFHRILLLALLFMAAARWEAVAQTASGDEMWVQIRYLAWGPGKETAEYYGLIHKSDFIAVMGADQKPNLVLRVTRVSKMENGQIVPLSEENPSGAKSGLRNVMYIRADSIVRVVELDDTFVTQRLLPLKD
jgi:hypothetical protein